MERILSVANMRNSDAATIEGGVPGAELMMRAGRGIYDAVSKRHGWQGPVLIVCGSGNNAGDGYVIAGLLKEAGTECTLCLTSDKFSDDGKLYFDRAVESGVKAVKAEDVDFDGFPTIVDCLYGTGFHGKVKESVADIIRRMNKARENGSFVISVDINSGLNGDNGMSALCVISDLTVSIGDYKPGHFLNMAKDVMKEKVNCPIGIEPAAPPFYLVGGEDVKECFPKRKNFSNKGTYGYVALIGGSARYSGAVRLAAMAGAAMRGGAGVCTVACPKSLKDMVAAAVLESTVFPLSDAEGDIVFDEGEFRELISNRKAIAFGMGIGKSEETKKALRFLLKEYTGILIVDADGLNCLSEVPDDEIFNCVPKLVITPHVKEFSRLTGVDVAAVLENMIPLAKRYAAEKNAYVLLKGPSTVVTDGIDVYIVAEGCPGMATAGSGDVLSGILAAVLGANPDKVLMGVAAGAWINGRAGSFAQAEMGAVSMIAGDTVSKIAEAVKSLG
ncbi:MAG: NAD(P)H-hydrate dehydratase [Lachnospiraceae bacterium]|nr:NAD(P)H-hydrate dehydratase [Lachnospiraceae bacterium]